jgi:hypothetical protein
MILLNYKRLRVSAISLLCVISLSAIAGGLTFMVDPWGRKVGIATTILRHSPFSNFFIPGLILFVVIGITSLLTALAVIVKIRHHRNFIFLEGCILSGWIGIQIVMLHLFHPLHFLMGMFGVLLVAISIKLR